MGTIDPDATALQAARARSSSIWGDGTLHMWGSIRGKAHPLPRNAQSNGQHFSGAMEETSGQKVQKGEHTTLAVFSYTLVFVSVALPSFWM